MKQYKILNLQGLNTKHYKRKELEFDYIIRKEFEELEKNQSISVIGFIDLNTTNKNYLDTVTINCNGRFYNFELIYLKEQKPINASDKNIVKEKINKSILGYILLDDGSYVAIVNNKKLFIILPFLLIAFGIIGCCFL